MIAAESSALEIGIAVAAGGAVGACARSAIYILIDRMRVERGWLSFPSGTAIVNAIGSLLLGCVVGLAGLSDADADTLLQTEPVRILLAVGFCGSLTTFSTFVADFEQLRAAGQRKRLVVHLLANVLLSIGAVAAGLAAFEN